MRERETHGRIHKKMRTMSASQRRERRVPVSARMPRTAADVSTFQCNHFVKKKEKKEAFSVLFCFAGFFGFFFLYSSTQQGFVSMILSVARTA